MLTFLFFPSRQRRARAPSLLDWMFVGAVIVALSGRSSISSQFVYRAADPTTRRRVLGAICDPARARGDARAAGGDAADHGDLAFILYAFFGPLLDLVGLGTDRPSRL